MDTITSLPPIAAIGIAVLVGIVLIALNYGWLIAARDKYSAQQRERLRMEDERRKEMAEARESLDEALSTLRRHVHSEPDGEHAEGEHADGQALGTDDDAPAPPAEAPGPRARAGTTPSSPRGTAARPDDRRPEP